MLQRIVLRAFPNNCLSERTSCPFLVLRVFVTLFNLQGAHRQPAGASYYHIRIPLVNTFFDFFKSSSVGSTPLCFLRPLRLLTFRLLKNLKISRPLVSDLPILPPHFHFVNTFFSCFFKFFKQFKMCCFPRSQTQDMPHFSFVWFAGAPAVKAG